MANFLYRLNLLSEFYVSWCYLNKLVSSMSLVTLILLYSSFIGPLFDNIKGVRLLVNLKGVWDRCDMDCSSFMACSLL